MELQMVMAALERIEGKLDAKADADDVKDLEKRTRKNENDLTTVRTVGSIATLLSGFIGWKF